MPAGRPHRLSIHEAHTVAWAGLKGTKNGELLDAAESAGYNALLTMDQGFEHQLSLAGRGLALIILVARSNQMEDLVPLVPVALAALDQVRPGSVVRVQAP